VLVYNRVQKAGSSTLFRLIEMLAERHNFTVEKGAILADSAEMSALVARALEAPGRSVIVRHALFGHGSIGLADGRVAFMNVMREPAARCRSVFYFSRLAEMLARPKRASRAKCDAVLAVSANATLDACLAPTLANGDEREPSCIVASSCHAATQASFFCSQACDFVVGRALRCSLDSDVLADVPPNEVVADARRTIERAYRVVGVTERLVDTIDVLERVFPSFFGGGGALFRSLPTRQQHVNSRPDGASPDSPAALAWLRRFTAPDGELYAHVSRRFDALHAACRIGQPAFARAT
jgi:hypothetical protein